MAKKHFKLEGSTRAFMASVSLMALAVGFAITKQPQINVQKIAESENKVMPLRFPVASVMFQNDTLDHYASALLTYQDNKVIRYFVKNSRLHRMQLPYFVHEWWHHHNKRIKYWRKIRYSPSQFIQLRMHEEISANVAAILTADLEYQMAKNKKAVIAKYEKSYMSFYFDAVKDGTIKPESTKPEDLDKKYTLLMNGAIRMWERMFRAHYTPSLELALKQYLRDYGFRSAYPDNYQKILSHMYTFGGVDLSRYIKSDASFLDIKVKIFDEMAGVKSFNRLVKQRDILVNGIFDNAKYLSDFSISQRPAVLEHIVIASKLKFELQKLNGYALQQNSLAITAAYRKVLYELARDPQYGNFIDKCADINMTPAPYALDDPLTLHHAFPVSSLLAEEDKEVISKIYQYRGIDLTALINDFDINFLPSKKENIMQTALNYFSMKPSDELINKTPSEYWVSPLKNSVPISSDVITIHAPQKPVHQSRKAKHRLSDNLFVNIPNFEEALLHPEAMTDEAKKQLRNLFKEFDDIPAEFKSCDIEAIQKIVEKDGDPQYFTDKKHPFLPKSSHKKAVILDKNRRKNDNLATIRQFKRRRASAR